MPDIHLLEDELINKIAAGEVVERPFSVVKELVENSIDAGACEIRVELKEGGKDSIIVSDDGCGIPKEQAKLALTRHATSKLFEVDDLFAVDSLGFRGEALASIASVGRLTLMTRQQGQKEGVKVSMVDGKLTESPWIGKMGTTIVVKDLFHSIPARKRFLKRAASEYAAVLEYIQAMALNLPEVGFTLLHNDKEQLRLCPLEVAPHEYLKGEKPLRERAKGIFGIEESEKLLYCVKETKYGNLEALISSPGNDKAVAKHIHTFVNGRWVKDKVLRYGVTRGYHSHLLKGRYPAVIMHVSIEPSLVDVNCHPAKTELKFQYSSEIQTAIATMIKETIRSGAWGGGEMVLPKKEEGSDTLLTVKTKSVPSDFDLIGRGKDARGGKPRQGSLWEVPPLPDSHPSPQKGAGAPRSVPPAAPRLVPPAAPRPKVPDMTIKETRMSFNGIPDKSLPQSEKPQSHGSGSGVGIGPGLGPSLGPGPGPGQGQDQDQGQDIIWSSLNFIGSYYNCYLLFDLGKKLLCVDQHAFHERILYERFLNDYKSLGDAQNLLMPESLDLPSHAIDILKNAKDTLKGMGFTIDFLSGGTMELSSVPSLLKDSHFDQLFAELAESLENGSEDITETGISHRVLSTMACHGAVRAGERLGVEDVQALISEAEGIDFFLNCPHGRRVFRTFTLREVEGWFDR